MNKEQVLRQLGTNIRALRKARQMSQLQLAHVIGKDQQSIQRLESGRINPSYLYLCEIATSLNVPVSVLVADQTHDQT